MSLLYIRGWRIITAETWVKIYHLSALKCPAKFKKKILPSSLPQQSVLISSSNIQFGLNIKSLFPNKKSWLQRCIHFFCYTYLMYSWINFGPIFNWNFRYTACNWCHIRSLNQNKETKDAFRWCREVAWDHGSCCLDCNPNPLPMKKHFGVTE